MWVWNLTASAPASAAASIRARAWPMLPSWLLPISATMNVGLPGPMGRPAICMRAGTLAPAPRQQQLCERQIRGRVDVVRALRGHPESEHVLGDEVPRVDR